MKGEKGGKVEAEKGEVGDKGSGGADEGKMGKL